MRVACSLPRGGERATRKGGRFLRGRVAGPEVTIAEVAEAGDNVFVRVELTVDLERDDLAELWWGGSGEVRWGTG